MFSSKTPSSPPRPASGSRAISGSTFSVLGADMAIKGDIVAGTDLHIDGKVEGDITCASLVQGESSEVTGAIKAETARFAGVVHGSITARDLVVLSTARIHGDVHYDSLSIEQGAQVDGRLSPRGTVHVDESEPHLTLAASSAS